MNIAILGSGTFATALANSIKPSMPIVLFTIEADCAEDINTNHRNSKYYPNKILSENISATTSFADVADADMVFIAIPSGAVVDIFTQKKFKDSCIVINGSKGFAKENLLICQFLQNLIPEGNICTLKGPSFASEMIFDIPTAFTIGATNRELYKNISDVFRSDLIVTDYSEDIIGVEYMSVVKNIYAIVMGIVDAYYNSPNVRFLVFTKIVREITRLFNNANINPNVLYHYCGIGDLGLTSLNDLSRNRTLGLFIGKGFFDINFSQNHVLLEGLQALNEISSNVSNNHDDYPIIYQASLLLQNKVNVKNFIHQIIFYNGASRR